MLALIPQSSTATTGPPRRAMRVGRVGATSAMNFSSPYWGAARIAFASTSSEGRSSAGPTSRTPRTTPFERRCSVSRRVSTPWTPGTSSSRSHSSSGTPALPMVGRGRPAHDHAPGLHLGTLEAGKAVRVPVVRRNAVVPDQRVRERQDLATERRVRERLGVPDHPGREDDLPDPPGRGAETGPIEARPVLEK